MNGVWAYYNKNHPILCNVNMSIERGSNYAIVGKSGSGKSTLLRVINGMMLAAKGAVSVDYIHPNLRDKKFRTKMTKIGYIPQNLGLVRNTSVLDNVLIGTLPRISIARSLLRIFPEKEIEYAKHVLEIVGLDGKEERHTHMLSGGERRRVAIARALAQKPILLLADEIVSELDMATAYGIMDIISEAQKKFQLTAIMVHHDINLALKYADRVAVINEGKKVLEIGVDGDNIVDFQTGDLTQKQILEMYND
ncbi:MAG: phosphate ABC transporter ATPase [Cenarchaeum symbiont of Oopsacas minuta]|nr:phosphate ABC transporter ATPase [Cenarchaeum symbiont of Oopsacas minuta]